MPPLTGINQRQFPRFESLRDQFGGAGPGGGQVDQTVARFPATIPSGPSATALTMSGVGRWPARYPPTMRLRRDLASRAPRATSALVPPANRKRTANSRRRAAVRPSVRPCGPFRQSRLFLLPWFAPVAPQALSCSCAAGLPGRVSSNVKIVSQSVKHKILVDRPRRAGIGSENKVRGIRSVRQDEAQGAGTMLADFVAEMVWADVAAQHHEAKRSILNFFATAPGSAHDPAANSALDAAVQRRSDIGDHRPSGTARCDGCGVRQRDFGQSARFRRYPSGHDHSSGGARRGAGSGVGASAGFSGQAVLTAFILGVESSAASATRYPRTLCAWLAHHLDLRRVRRRRPRSRPGLERDQIANAIGIAASQSAGIVENLPSAAKNVSVGNAARNGLFAALLAAEGYSASPRAIEGLRSAGPAPWVTSRMAAPDGRSRQDLGDREEHLQALSGGHCVSCRHRRLLQFAAKLNRRIDEIAPSRCRLGAVAGARRPAGSQRTRRAGQHSSLRRLCAAAG